MKLSSVHDLKAELLSAHPFSSDGIPAAFALVGMTEQAASGLRDEGVTRPDSLALALGIGSGTRSGDYVLAVRVQSTADGHRVAEEVQRRARGECDVRLVPEVSARTGIDFFQGRRRPLECGLSTGVVLPRGRHAGTLGCIVEMDGRAHILSNNHVLAAVNASDLGDPVTQPGTLDRAAASDTLVGVLAKYVPLSFQTTNFVDAALARLLPGTEYYWRWNEAIGDQYGKVRKLRTSDLGAPVVKAGRTTGITSGRITAVEIDQLQVNMGSRNKPKIARFDDQFEVTGDHGEPFSLAGDSGSLILTPGGDPLGLLFAGGRDENGIDLTYANRLDRVLDELGIASL